MSTPSEAGFSSLLFGSCFAYAPHGEDYLALESRQLCARLKSADPASLVCFAIEVRRASRAGGVLDGLFGQDVALIPVPGSGTGRVRPWVAGCLAQLLRQCGLAVCVWPMLQRRYPVPRSASAAAGQRPDCRLHRVSFALDRLTPPAARIVLVDDVITKGRTLMAAAACVREMLPQVPTEAFALLRTLQRGEPLTSVLQPCRGVIEWTGRDARRTP